VKLLKGGGSRNKLVEVRGARCAPEELFPPGKTTPRSKKTVFFPAKT